MHMPNLYVDHVLSLCIPALLDLLRRSSLCSQCQLLFKWSCQAIQAQYRIPAFVQLVIPALQKVTGIVPLLFLD